MRFLAGRGMSDNAVETLQAAVANFLERHWKSILVGLWLAYAIAVIASRWTPIQAFALPDTDDNLRMAQVRGLLGGQGWFDLTQHRFDPAHGGGNIHWSRLVDLPLAGIILLMKPLVGGGDAERTGVAVATPMP